MLLLLKDTLSIEDDKSEADTGFRERGGVGCRGYGYFMLGHFVAGHITRCMDNILGDNTPVKIARGTKCWPFYGTGRPKCQYYQNILYMILMIK